MNVRNKKLTRISVLAALAVVLILLIRFPIIPQAPYLEYEPGDVPILIGTFMYGPLAGLALTVIASMIQMLTVSMQGGWVGAVMHIIATGTFVIVASLIYKLTSSRMRTIHSIILALILGSIAMIAIMIPANLFFSVNFYGYPYDAVKAMIVPVLIPFNAFKSSVNALLTLLLFYSYPKIFKA